jgi:2-iminobutanoate/2-iminopropanoate deaminase
MHMTRQIVHTEAAPPAVGPYSQAVVANGLVYTAGQLGLDPQTRALVAGGVEAQTKQALTNLRSVLEAAGSGMDRVVKTTVFLKDMDDFAAMNAVYASFFAADPPARSAVQVARLPLDGLVEIEAVALLG